MLRTLLAAIAVVCAAALVGRVTGLAPTGGGAHSQRLAWPVTYVNGLGLVAVSGVLLAVGLRLAPRGSLAVAALCAAPPCLTFSRSALLVGGAALLVLARCRVADPADGRDRAGAVVLAGRAGPRSPSPSRRGSAAPAAGRGGTRAGSST